MLVTVLVGISEIRLTINKPATAWKNFDYNWFAGQMLLQTEE